MSDQQLVTLIKELAEHETGDLRYRGPEHRSTRVRQRRFVLLAVGTCATAVAAVVAVVASAGSAPSAIAPGYAATSPSEPAWFAPSVDYGPSTSAAPGRSDNDGPRIQALVARVQALLPQAGPATGAYEDSGSDANVRVHFSLPGDEFLTVAQEQMDRPLDIGALLQGFPSTVEQPRPYELADGVQMLVVGGTIYAVSPTGFLTTLRLDVGRPNPAVTADGLRAVADGLTRITMGLATPSVTPTTLALVPDVVGSTENAAEQALAGAGLSFAATTSPSDNSSFPAGVVVAQAPQAGSHVPPGTAVDITISSGPG